MLHVSKRQRDPPRKYLYTRNGIPKVKVFMKIKLMGKMVLENKYSELMYISVEFWWRGRGDGPQAGIFGEVTGAYVSKGGKAMIPMEQTT